MPNGGRVNLGCYGNTAEASKSAATGIDELRITNYELRVYPNPTNGELRITKQRSAQANCELRIENVTIYDIMGRPVEAYCIRPNENGAEILMNISHLSAGIYFLKIGNETVKIVKE
jgi:hypothetical protein